MRLTILGSGTNVHPRRAAAGYLVETDRPMLMDLGPRTLSNLLKTSVDRHRITHLLFSHFHADHFSDFITFYFDAVIYSKLVRRRPDLTLIGPRGSRKLFRAIIRIFPVFSEAPFRTRIEEVGDETFSVGTARITAQSVRHTSRLHCLGYRVSYRGRTMAYSGDSMYCDALVSLCDRADVAVLDCSYPSNRPGPAHMHAGECGQVAEEAQIGRLLLSHFYTDAERFDVKRQAARTFRGSIARARDLMTVRW
ncbi:arylsulfatase [Nitrospira sp.]|nr:arylsulfatase [Nitrospira sp.]